MSGVFVSYRRADAQGWAGRLGADLADAFGDVARFFDLASIPLGVDFLLEIENSVADSAAVLVLIGPLWLDLRDDQGQRRLDAPDDVVAAEVAHALTLRVPVIPILLGGARMPRPEALPERLRALARRNAHEMSDSRWDYDRDRLFDALERATPLKRRVASSAAAAPSAAVSVGAGLSVSDSRIGNVIGAQGAAPAGGVDVLKGATLSGVTMGDLVGVQVTPPAPKDSQP